MLFGTRQLIGRLRDITIRFLGKDLSPSPFCKDLGIIIDSILSFNEHIDYLLFSFLGKLCQINRVRHLFTKDVLLVVLNSLVFSKLFYCSTVWSGTTQQNIRKLQLLQNFAARILTGKRKYDHISPILKDLRWLTVKEMLQLRVNTAWPPITLYLNWLSALKFIIITPGKRAILILSLEEQQLRGRFLTIP